MTNDNDISLEVLEKINRAAEKFVKLLERIERSRQQFIKTAVVMAKEASEKRKQLAGIKRTIRKSS